MGSYKAIAHLTERLLSAALADIDAPVQGELDLTQPTRAATADTSST